MLCSCRSHQRLQSKLARERRGAESIGDKPEENNSSESPCNIRTHGINSGLSLLSSGRMYVTAPPSTINPNWMQIRGFDRKSCNDNS
ncbi:hypothetical protein KQX54_001972 [Cotesia glomerata]|uniref:Uncharacterized protein n=1 Tax=Cotesia glomerata TaxID=32391 RepID=A0AAV7II96_COTGL|nr:hypothetical protein KQX54_001972 [Cotesia glomerata]